MPPIVIDLLSSPELPVRPSVNTSKTATTKAIPKKALEYKAPELNSDGWHNLSSDDLPNILAPPKATSNTTKTTLTKRSSPKHSQTTPPLTDEELAWKLQSELDEQEIIQPQAAASVSTSTAVIGGRDFFYLEDDFDSSVNFDDSLPLNHPVPKKRRLSPSPEPTTAKAPKASGYQRSSSNVERPSKTVRSRASPGLKRSKTLGAVLESDPIMFTSSPDPFADAAKHMKDKCKEVLIIDVDDDDDDDPFSMPTKQTSKKQIQPLATTSMNSLALNSFEFEDSSDIELPDIGSISGAHVSSLSKSDFQAKIKKYNAEKAADKKKSSGKISKAKLSQADKDAKAAETAEKRATKENEKEAEKERKRVEKEKKAANKEMAAEYAKANTLRTDKKVATPEMIVDLPSCLGVKLSTEAKAYLDPLKVDHTQWESSVGPVIKWRRKVEANFNEERGEFVPCPHYIKDEDHIMYVMGAQEFVDLATGEEGKDLDAHVLRLKAKFPSNNLIYLIEGLTPWMRKNKNVKNRAFQAAFRGEEAAPSQSQRRRKKQPEYIDEDLLEDALLRLQVVHKPLIHHTNATIESAQWIVAFTQHMSTIPYKRAKDKLDTTFSMESGQVKTGEDAADTFTKMLGEIKMITSAVACGIATEFPTVPELIKGLREHGPLALEDCRKSANKDGALTDRRVGPAISKRVYKVFLGRNDSELI